jgi:hypothetical protein
MSIDRELDKWAAWVLHRRDGDDREQHEKALEHLIPIRVQLLVDVEPGSWVVDWERLLNTSRTQTPTRPKRRFKVPSPRTRRSSWSGTSDLSPTPAGA